jgi:hypothetical protein
MCPLMLLMLTMLPPHCFICATAALMQNAYPITLVPKTRVQSSLETSSIFPNTNWAALLTRPLICPQACAAMLRVNMRIIARKSPSQLH